MDNVRVADARSVQDIQGVQSIEKPAQREQLLEKRVQIRANRRYSVVEGASLFPGENQQARSSFLHRSDQVLFVSLYGWVIWIVAKRPRIQYLTTEYR